MKFLGKYIDDIWLWFIVFVAVVGFLVFYLLPFALGIYYSFFDLLENQFIGLVHYHNLFTSELFRLALLNTARFTFLSLALVFFVSFSVAYVLCFTVIGRKIPRSLLVFPLVVPTVSISFVWYWWFHHRGFLSAFLYWSFSWQTNFFSGTFLYLPLLILFLWRYAGFSILIYLAGMLRLPQEQIDAFNVESNNRLLFIWHILLPHERSCTTYILLLNLIFSMNIFREIYVVWSNYPPRALYMMQHFVYNNFLRLQYERAVAGSTILAVFILIIMALILIYERQQIS